MIWVGVGASVSFSLQGNRDRAGAAKSPRPALRDRLFLFRIGTNRRPRCVPFDLSADTRDHARHDHRVRLRCEAGSTILPRTHEARHAVEDHRCGDAREERDEFEGNRGRVSLCLSRKMVPSSARRKRLPIEQVIRRVSHRLLGDVPQIPAPPSTHLLPKHEEHPGRKDGRDEDESDLDLIREHRLRIAHA